MTEAMQSGFVEFRPRARLLKLIGAELISDDILAITELVKNAHDADASRVVVEFRGVTGSDGAITVRDDGHGMDLDVLLRHWMEPAGTSKSGKNGKLTPSGRRVLGEKGVGRFAADKLGQHLELVSRGVGQSKELRAVFDWDEFDTDSRLLSDVKNRWETRIPRELERTGTVLRITGLRTLWNERMFRRLSTRLTRLRSPFSAMNSFTIHIDSDEFPQYSGELRSDILERAPYRIDAAFDGRQTVEVNANGSRSVEHLWNGHGDLRCGPVRVRLFAFDLETEAIARIGPRMEVRAWLKEWSGISVYRDGFRVWPYGEPHDDWLRLDQRRVNNPVTRLSNNQIVGFVEITRDGNPELTDQTNREGILQSRALDDLRRLMYFVLQLLESQRQSVRHPTVPRRTAASTVHAPELTFTADLYRLARSAPPELASELRHIAERLEETSAREEAQRRLFTEGYSELAAVGQAAVGLSRVAQPLLGKMREQLRAVREVLDGRSHRAAVAALRDLEGAAAVLEQRTAVLAPLEGGEKHRGRTMDVPMEVESFIAIISPQLSERGIRVVPDLPRSGVLRVDMRPESFHRILHILMANSLEWLHATRDPEVRIKAGAREEVCEILFSDNGAGIAREMTEQVFQPLFSTREGGRGMGLTIARNIVSMHGGTIDVLQDGRRRGATLRICLPRKRSRATIHRH
jgi:signal transduction histidine kinase